MNAMLCERGVYSIYAIVVLTQAGVNTGNDSLLTIYGIQICFVIIYSVFANERYNDQ